MAVLLGVLLWVVSRRPRSERSQRWLLAGLGAGSLAIAAKLTVNVLQGEPLLVSDVDLLQQVQGWLPSMSWLLEPVSFIGNVYTLSTILFVLFAVLAARRQWRDAYFALAAGPGLLGAIFILKDVIGRAPPLHGAFSTPFASFPNAVAAIFPVLVATFAWLFLRDKELTSRRRIGLIGAGVVTGIVVLSPFLAGTAWLTDVLGGAALGIGWFSLCAIGYEFASELTGSSRAATVGNAGEPGWVEGWASDLADQWAGARAWLARHCFERPTAIISLIVLGVLIRLTMLWSYDLGVDANVYAVMAESILERGDLSMPWGPIYEPGNLGAPSHHYPPLYPIVLAGFYKVFGFSQFTTHLASVVISLAAMGVTYICTRDLYGHTKGLIATAVVAVSPILLQNTGKAYTASLVILLFVATLWAILKSLDEPVYIVPAGLLAGLGYLAKSSMGYFFVIAGLGGLAWRFYWHRWEVFKDKYYMVAIAIFGSLIGVWWYRNWSLFGSFDTSQHLSAVYVYGMQHPVAWAMLTVLAFLFMFGMAYLLFMGMLPWLPAFAEIPLLDSEHDSGLWLAFGLPLILTSVIDGGLWLYEDMFHFNNVRYVSFAIIPMAWLLMRHVDISRRDVKIAAVLSFLLLTGGAVVYAMPAHHTPNRVADDLAAEHAPGESVAFMGMNGHGLYRFYWGLTDDGQHETPIELASEHDAADLDADWVVVDGHTQSLPDSYTLVRSYGDGSSGHPTYTSAGSSSMQIWQRVG